MKTITCFKSISLLTLALIGAACTSVPENPRVDEFQPGDTHNPGTRFDRVLEVLRSNPYEINRLPTRPAPIAAIRSKQMLADAGRTLDSTADIRAPFQRILHPNGVCLVGEWIMDKSSPYSGLFKQGSRFPIIARASPPHEEVVPRKSHMFSFGIVGKVFPSEDPQLAVKTANFITQTDIGGYLSPKSKILYSDLAMANAPDVTAVNRGAVLPAFSVLGNVLDQVDAMTTQRQIYPLAEAHKAGETTRTPQFMKLTLDPSLDTPGDGEEQDVRLEIWRHLQTKGPLIYDVTVSDDGRVIGPAFLRKSFVHWDTAPIGRIVFTEAILSQACDDQIHFQHPAWRNDVNDPTSSVRAKHGTAFGQPLVRDQMALGGEVLSKKTIRQVFNELNNIKAWPNWIPEHLVHTVAENPEEGFYDIQFEVNGDGIRSTCKHDALTDSVVSVSCRGTTQAPLFLKSRIDDDLTFFLSEAPGGQTRITWALLLRAKKAAEVRDKLQASVQTGLAQHFN